MAFALPPMPRKSYIYTVLAILLLGMGALFYMDQVLEWKRPPANWERLEQQLKDNFPEIAPILPAQLSDRETKTKDTAWILLDVRPRSAYAVSHLPQAVPAPDAKSAIAAATGKELVVLYDETGRRSADVGREMAKLGFKGHIQRLKGGIFTWAIEKRPLVDDGDKPTDKVAPGDDEHWAKLLPDGLKAK